MNPAVSRRLQEIRLPMRYICDHLDAMQDFKAGNKVLVVWHHYEGTECWVVKPTENWREFMEKYE